MEKMRVVTLRLFLCLLVCVALELAPRAQCTEYQWSGFVNSLGDPIDFTCPDDQVVVGLASDFSATELDRRWEFQCATGGGLANISASCTLEDPINSLQGDIEFDCPSDGYFAGFVSEFTPASSDRVWQPYCCDRPFASLVRCQILTSNWENVLRENLNYSAPAGFVVAGAESFYFNRDRRWRFRACEIEVNCGDPGVPENAVREGSSFLYQDTVVFTCNNGYYQSSGPEGGVRTCLDTGLWSDTQPVCSLCTDIPNCIDIRCTNASDHTCSLCASNNGLGLGEAGFRNLVTECEPLCSWLGGFCYPGECLDDITSCNCSQGFAGPDCLQITISPDLMSCCTAIRSSDGRELQTSCLAATATPLHTNIAPSNLTADWSSVFVEPSPLRLEDAPAYVDGFLVGVALSEIRTFLYRAANPTRPVSMTTHSCQDTAPSSDTPSTSLTVCSAQATPTDLDDHTFLHGDTFEVQAYVLNGGYLDVLNLDTDTTTRNYYNGTATVGRATFIIDLEAPTHCSLVSSISCLANQNILDLGVEITDSDNVTATWGGWSDAPSGVLGYTLEVFEMTETDDVLRESVMISSEEFNHTGQNVYTFVQALPNEGPYSFILQSRDVAGNVRLARRLVLFDDNSSLEIDNDAPLRVISAVPESGFQWQNSTADPLVVSGRGHFFNTNLRSSNFLAAVANYTSDIGTEYDHPLSTGRYPRSGTLNALGVTELFYDIIIDRMGGASEESVTQPEVFRFQTADVGIEAVEISTTLEDGDSVRIWFMASDFNFREVFDSVLVHIDSTSPVVRNLGLEFSGVTDLALHGTGSLLDLNIRFQTYDEHSGIATIEWFIGTEPGASNVGYGNVPVQNVNETDCLPPSCVCDALNRCTATQYSFSPLTSDFPDSTALHDTCYYITVSVRNHAHLPTSLTRQITIDTTPPLPGAVFDASFESPDRDFVAHDPGGSAQQLESWWTGFFDRETDVAFYQYIFTDHCANESYFTFPLMPDSAVAETRDTFATWVPPAPGTHYATVVAYNNALRPSVPVCSDGITTDTAPPSFEGVVIPGAVVAPGLALGPEGEVWLIDSNRERLLAEEPSEMCTDQATPLSDLSQYPIRMASSTPVTFDPTECSQYSAFLPSVTYLTSDFLLNATWVARDDTGIRSFMFGIISAEDFDRGSPIVYYPTAGQSHFSIHDADIIAAGNTFYVSVLAVDVSQRQTTVTAGPILVDLTPPLLNGSLQVERSGRHVIVTWDQVTFTDDEDINPVSQFEYAIGRTEFGVQIQPFTSLPPTSLEFCSTPYCVAIDTNFTPLLSGHQYFVTVKARNSAGLVTMATVAYTHISAAPSTGLVWDIDTSLEFDIAASGISSHDLDVDLLVDPLELATTWRGFDHAHLNTSYSVGLGSQPGLDNVSSFASVGQRNSYTFTGVGLVHGERYYVTVVAENEYGSSSATSDGVLVLQDIGQTVMDYATVFDGGAESDLDYQASTTFAAARWFFPEALSPYISHYRWAVYRAEDGDMESLAEVKPFENVGSRLLAASGGVQLLEGELYVSAVQACHFTACLPAVYSDGFRVATPPEATYVRAMYTPLQLDAQYGTSSVGILEISWGTFIDPEIVYYEWSLGTGEPGHELVIYWNRVSEMWNEISVVVNETISLHTPNTVTVRGYNNAGLYSNTSTQLQWEIDGQALPQEAVPRSRLAVVDIPASQVPELQTTDWRELEYREWDLSDLEYSNSRDSLSAAWPDLRYTSYSYSISTSQSYQPCGSAQDPACGTTIANAVTVSNLDLTDGQRYYFCVQALREDAIHETSSTPSVLVACSNGITVDFSPPLGGCVQIIPPRLSEEGDISSGGGPSGFVPLYDTVRECSASSRFQAATSEIRIVWDQFVDVERSGNAVHASGVAYYEYALGTFAGASDVVGFTPVGVATEAIAQGLQLWEGQTIFATIRANDFTGQWSEAISPGITVDVTPPIINQIWLEGIVANWEPVEERESEVASVELGLGSRPGSSDLLQWTGAGTGGVLGRSLNGSGLQDGQLVFLSLAVQNGAGLTAVSSSLGYTLDVSPPEGGTVYDGPQTQGSGEVFDLDYTASLTTLSAHWRGFSDPHTGISEYFWAIGSCTSCSNVQEFTSVGVATGATRRGLSLTHGRKYYVTVRGCNSGGLCTEASSNGITVDTTPPIAGRVVDGYTGNDQQYQASRSFVSAHWTGFHDAESSLQSFVFFVGLEPNDSSIIPPMPLPPSETSFLLPSLLVLPSNATLYTTVIAYNNVGMSTQVSSDGVYIHDTAPEVSGPVAINTYWAGSAGMATQYSNSVIRVDWNFTDSLTTVNQHFWTLWTTNDTLMPLPGKKAGTQDYGTCTNLELSDGDSYSPLVVACNMAGLCSYATGSPVFIDSSPPIDGYFAVETDSVIELYRTVPGGMTWRNRLVLQYSQLNIAFIGFSDPHSGVAEYWATVGTSFSQSDLTSGAVILDPSNASDNGTRLVQVQLVRLLDVSEVIYISLWVVNGVGLRSHIVQGSFRIDEVPDRTNNGTLTLLRSSRCPVETCEGHCTCAARGQLCDVDPALVATCQELASLSPDMQLTVSDVVPQVVEGGDASVLFTAVTDKLIGRWEKSNPDSTAFVRLEWTVGERGFPPGTGLIDTANDPIWRDTGTYSMAIFTPSLLRPLQHGLTYVFHVRAWYSNTTYAIFTSAGVTVDTAGPEISRGLRVREVSGGTDQVDIDFSPSSSTIHLSWAGVFVSTLSGSSSTLDFGLGDLPGTDNVFPFTQVMMGTMSTELSGLSLGQGRRYFSTVRATSLLGVITTSVSDGFTVDLTPPNIGTVVNGLRYSDLRAQMDTTAFPARWFGFNDPESAIHHYEIAITNSPQTPDESSYASVGIGLRATAIETLVPGETYYAHIVAVNIANLRSEDAVSSGMSIDNTRPIGVQCSVYSPELLSNPSFEGDIPPATCTDVPSPNNATAGWVLNATHADVLLSSADFVPYDGCFSLLLVGTLSQAFPTAPGTSYRLSFALRRYVFAGSEHLALFQAKLTAPGISRIVTLEPQQRGSIANAWRRFEFVFTAVSVESVVTLQTVGYRYGILVDGFSIRRCDSISELDSPDTIVQWPNIITLSQEYISHSITRVYGSWNIDDPESGIREYLWAIGTVPGGEQLQRYTSTGNAGYGLSGQLEVTHGSSVYVSVLAWNHAGLERVVYSEAFVVDFTPPVLGEGGVLDGMAGVDVDYLASAIVPADWSAITDSESGIAECRWAIGTSPGATDLQSYVATSSNISSVNLSSTVTHGTTAYSTVLCTNGAGLQLTAYSDSVTILLDPPSNTSAFANLSSPTLTKYEVLWLAAGDPTYIPSRDLVFRWGGFSDPAGVPLTYEVRVSNSSATQEWNGLRFANMLTLSDLSLPEEVLHTIEVRALNLAGVPSASLALDFVIATSPPVDTGVPINMTWTENTLLLDWEGRFNSSTPLYYEFSLGTQVGSGSIRRWVELETDQTFVTVTDTRLNQGMDYFLALTAISSTGLHTTADPIVVAGISASW